jgi:Flp pilus assembly pilin Flp
VCAAVILGVAVAVALITAVDYVGTALRMRRASATGAAGPSEVAGAR